MLRLSLFILLIIFTISCSSERDTQKNVERDSKQYQSAVQNFRVSLAASETDESRFAFDKMNEVAVAFPEEPAAWANLGVMAMRQGNRTLSLDRFENALTLAPEHPDVMAMAADANSRFGESKIAIEYYEKALSALNKPSTEPNQKEEFQISEPILRFSLYQEYQRDDPATNEEQMRTQLADLLSLLPENLPLALEFIRFAVSISDSELLDASIKDFKALIQNSSVSTLSESEIEALQSQVEQIQARVESGDRQRAILALTLLRTSLEPQPRFQEQLLEIQFPVNQVGSLLRNFISLPEIQATPFTPDINTRFALEAFTNRDLEATISLPVTLLETAPPFLITLTETEIQVDSAISLPLPIRQGSGTLPYPSRQFIQIDPFLDFRNSIAVAGPAGFRFYRHIEDERFEDYTAKMNLPQSPLNRPYHGVWIVDMELDGDLDLLLSPVGDAPKWIRNNSDGSFTWGGNLNLTGTTESSLRDVIQVRVADLDEGSDPELIFLEKSGRLTIYRNLRGGIFEVMKQMEESFLDFVVFDHIPNGKLDLIGLTTTGELVLYSPDEKATSWTRKSFSIQLDLENLSSVSDNLPTLFAADVDNNGLLDLILSGNKASQILLADSDFEWTTDPSNLLIEDQIVGLFDSDGDDRIDLAARQGVWMNSSTTPYQGSSVRIRAASADGDRRINSFGILGNIEVVSGSLYLRRTISEPIVHFGLGDHERAEMLRIIWPNGSVQTEFAELGLGATIFNEQLLKGSCPWLFTYNGEEMEFVTDVIWRSPLGLRINAQETAGVIQTLDRVRIAPHQLSATQDLYQLRVTAELWETHFFDHIALHAIDHPQGTMVSIDERFVFPAPDLSPVLHTLPEPAGRVIVESSAQSATDSSPQPASMASLKPSILDISREVAFRDDIHVQPFQKGVVQGVAKPHSIVIELNEPATDQTLLLLSGWLYPTDSSLNLLLSQSSFDRPSGLTVEVSSGDKNWVRLFDDFGTPAGKDKTILLPLKSNEVSTIRQVRLTTTSEIFWDAIQRAERLPDPIQESVLPVQRQELVYRGFSEWVQESQEIPLRPDYHTVTGTSARWSDLEGYYTRFGDVAELLTTVDDRYVIMNAGDELQLDFKAPDQPEKGMERTFVFISDGWVKDGDFNTEASRTVGPLPFHGMSDMQYPKEEPLHESPVFQRYSEDWHDYHTRYISNQIFPEALSGINP